jgi:hypothetical protein
VIDDRGTIRVGTAPDMSFAAFDAFDTFHAAVAPSGPIFSLTDSIWVIHSASWPGLSSCPYLRCLKARDFQSERVVDLGPIFSSQIDHAAFHSSVVLD